MGRSGKRKQFETTSRGAGVVCNQGRGVTGDGPDYSVRKNTAERPVICSMYSSGTRGMGYGGLLLWYIVAVEWLMKARGQRQ